ncbi:MAG: hypothetical protein ACOYN0_11410 [Phycisphaerales bacterium]
MKPSQKRMVVWGGVLGGAAVAWFSYTSVYANPRAELDAQISAIEGSIDRYQKIIDRRAEAEASLRAAAKTTLGVQLDLVEHRLRTGLTRLLEQEGLQGAVVNTTQPRERESPLTQAKGVPGPVKKILNASPDFVSLRATLKGTGTLEQVARCVAAVQAQPWLHRVEAISMRPVGKERERFELKMDVESLFLPDWAGKDIPEPEIAQVSEEGGQYAAAMAARNIFRRLKPPETVVTEATPPPPPPTDTPPERLFPPYEEWAVSGVMSGRSGLTVIMVNRRSGESRAVVPGETVLDAVLISGAGERAVFEIGGKRFEVTNGETLASRRPVG